MKTSTLTSPLLALASGLAGSLLILLIAVAFQVTASPQTDTVARQIPYSGTLEFDNQGVTLLGEDAIFLRFDIMDEGVEGDMTTVYSQTVQTEVFGGEFTTFLGERDDTGLVGIEEVVTNADALYLQITVLGNTNTDDAYGYHNAADPSSSTDDDAALSNPQRLLMSPFSLWATQATDFDASEGVNVGNALEVLDGEGNGATLADGMLDVSGDVTLGNGASNVSLALTEGFSLKLDNLSALTVASGQDVVEINPNGDFTGVVNHGSARATGATNIEGNDATANFPGKAFDLSLGANSSGTHGFRFGDTDNTSIQTGFDTGADQFVIEKTDGTDLFTIERGTRKATVYDDIQVNGALGVNGISPVTTMNVTGDSVQVNGNLRIGNKMLMTGVDPFDTDDAHIPNAWPTTSGDFVSNLSSSTALNSGGVGTGLERYTRGFCVLTGIKLSEMSSDSDASGCAIELQSNFWRLRAYSRGSGARCEARCFSWETSHFD